MAWWNREAVGRLRERLARALDLPGEAVLNLPKVTVVGSLQVSVENHRGIIEFTPRRVRIAAGEGAIEIRGQDLTLRSILPDEIILDGRIEAVDLNS